MSYINRTVTITATPTALPNVGLLNLDLAAATTNAGPITMTNADGSVLWQPGDYEDYTGIDISGFMVSGTAGDKMTIIERAR